MMKFLTARLRIAFGLALLVISVLFMAIALGFVPDSRRAALEGRASLCEALAIHSSVLMSRGEVARLEAALEAVVRRNGEIRSLALRRSDGESVIEIGEHSNQWSDRETVDSNVLVPIWTGSTRWGNVEVKFQPLGGIGVLGFLVAPNAFLVGFVGLCCVPLFLFYLRKVLEQLDPSRAVPQRVRTALDTLAEGILVLDEKGRIVLANRAFAERVGMEPERLQGRRAKDFDWTGATRAEDESPAPDAGQTLPWLDVIERREPVIGAVVGLAAANERTSTFMVNATPVTGDDAVFRGVLVSFEDITKLEEKEVELRRAMSAAESANRAKSDFLARMSHEIRTPMNAILGFADVLRRGVARDESERRDYLDTIHSSGTHLLHLINDLLDLSKVESGRMQVESARFSPQEVIADVCAVLRVRAEEKGVSLRFRSETPTPETIVSDPARFRQILTNLVGNAIKFTSSGGVELLVRLEQDAGKPQLTVAVADTGTGIPADSLETIFDPFTQADETVHRQFGGTGLGLAISRQFAQALGGDIVAESELGKGSVFTVRIDTGPLEGVELVLLDDTKRESPRQHETALEASIAGARVLLADDGEENRKLATLVLERAGAHVDAVTNGEEAVAHARNTEYDVVLLDMQMPVMDGYTAATTLRESGFERPIIALTAHAMHGAEEKCRAAGCSDFLTKPIDLDLLLSKLASTLPAGRAAGDTARDSARVAPSPARVEARDEPIAVVALRSTLPLDDPEIAVIVGEFVVRVRERVDGLTELRERGELDGIARVAHWLKGSGGTAGFHDLMEPAGRLEAAALAENLGELDACIEEIRALVERIEVPAVG